MPLSEWIRRIVFTVALGIFGVWCCVISLTQGSIFEWLNVTALVVGVCCLIELVIIWCPIEDWTAEISNRVWRQLGYRDEEDSHGTR